MKMFKKRIWFGIILSVTLTLVLKEQGFLLDYKKIKLDISFLRGVFFLMGTIHEGQVKIPSYTQYMSVFENPPKPLFVRVTAFWENYYL